jgi:hypothetical protein
MTQNKLEKQATDNIKIIKNNENWRLIAVIKCGS